MIEALIVCPPSHVAPLTDHVQATSPNLNVDIKAFEQDMDGPISTVAILRKISGRIQASHLEQANLEMTLIAYFC